MKKTDEILMEELQAYEQMERTLALQGYEGTEDFKHVQKTQLDIYNELNQRGWKWNNRENEWIKK